jgi:SWI/SNF-related matrix-associated actin-dependent regulator of chromatin subfamily B protein 1
MKMGGPGSAMSAPGGQLPSAIGKPPMGHGPPGSASVGPDGRMLNAAMQHHQQQQQQQQQAMANLPPGTDPARTRVIEVPLANSGTLIPPLSPKSIEELKAIVKRDDEYAMIKRDLDTRMREELSAVGGPQAWWEKDTVNVVPPTQKFGILWPGDKRRAKEKMKKKMGRKEMIRLYVPSFFVVQKLLNDFFVDRPRKLNSKEADLPEILVPIRLEFDVDQHKFKETFLWNLNGMRSPAVTRDVTN